MAKRFLPRAMVIALAAGVTVTGVQVAPDFAAEAQAATAQGKVPEAAKYSPMYNDLRVGPKSTVTSAPYFGNSSRAPHASFRLGHSEIPENLHVSVDERTGVITARADEVTQFATARVRVHIQHWDTTENVVDVNITLSPVGDDFVKPSNAHLFDKVGKVDKKAQNPTKIVGVRDPFKNVDAPVYRPQNPVRTGGDGADLPIPRTGGDGAELPEFTLADQYQPEYPSIIRVKQGDGATLSLRGAIPGSTYSLEYGPKWLQVDKETGDVTLGENVYKDAGSYQGTVKVSYADGSTDYARIRAVISPGPVVAHEEELPPELMNPKPETKPETTPTPETKPETKPETTPEAPKDNGSSVGSSKPKDNSSTVGSSKPKPSTSTSEVKPPKPEAKKTQAETANDTYGYHFLLPSIAPGGNYVAELQNPVAGATYTIKSGPEWVTVDAKTGKVFFDRALKPEGKNNAVITVKYPDGSTKDITLGFTIEPPKGTYAEIFAPHFEDVTVSGAGTLIVYLEKEDKPDELGVTGTKYALEKAPSWLTIDADRGILVGARTAEDVGTYHPVLVATYPDGSVDRAPFTLVIKPESANGSSTPGSSTGSSSSSVNRVEKAIRDARNEVSSGVNGSNNSSSTAGAGANGSSTRDVLGSSGGTGSSIDTVRKILPGIGAVISAAPGLSKEAQEAARNVQGLPGAPKPVVDGARALEENLRGADGALRELQGSSAKLRDTAGFLSKIAGFFRG